MRRTRIARFLVLVLGFIALLGIGLWLMQRRLIYFPDDHMPPVNAMQPGWQDVSFVTSDGLELHACYLPPEPDRPVVVVFHGNAGNRAGRMPLGTGLAGHGFGVLLTDYRGYGGNPGHPTETGLALDARAAVDFVRRQEPGHDLVFFGESLGAAVAVEVATAIPPAALVLRSPFASLADVGRFHYPLLPVGWLLKDRYQVLDLIGSVAAPTLVIAGDADSIIPFEQSRAVFDGAPEPKRLVVIPGADHNDAALSAGPVVIAAVSEFTASP
jgi:fermentation-respiration switch protein FrsA (DUF1100 family)